MRAEQLEDHADWLAAYDAPLEPPKPVVAAERRYKVEPIDGEALAVKYERCAQCRQLDHVGAVYPHYIQPVTKGGAVVLRWLHDECSKEWWERFREWREAAQRKVEEREGMR